MKVSSLTPLQIALPQQQSLNSDIVNSDTSDSNAVPSTQSSLQEQESVPITEGKCLWTGCKWCSRVNIRS